MLRIRKIINPEIVYIMMLTKSKYFTKVDLKVTDLKQYFYCKRIVYYDYVMQIGKKPTYKMEKGKVEQNIISRLESKRKLKKYGLMEGKRHFDIWLRSKELGLSGKLDMLIECPGESFVVDFKWTRGRPFPNHLFQLGGYALLVEEKTKKPANYGFLYLIIQEDVVKYEITENVKNKCLKALEEIRRMIIEEYFPDPPKSKTKCLECEYINFCRDIW